MTPEYKKYRRTQIAEMVDWEPGFNMDGVSVSEADKMEGSPRLGDKIARNPANHHDRWLVAEEYFLANFEALASHAPSVKLTAHEFEVLWSAVSKLESQVLRNPGLPQYYKTVCANAFEILRQLRNGTRASEDAAQPIAVKIAAVHPTPDDEIAECEEQTGHAKVSGTHFCRCTHVMYD